MEESYKTKYSELLKEHDKLKHDYSENVIIQSMNSMKEVYDEKVYEFDLLNEKYNLLNETYNHSKEMYNDLKNFTSKLESVHSELEKSQEYLSKRTLLLEENIRAVLIMLYTLKNSRRIFIDLKSKIQFIEDILYNALY